MAVVLVGGGARSGKSRYALERARRNGGRLVYLATAEALDEEMTERIARHRADRGAEFETVEEPVELARVIRDEHCGALVVDCLTLWLSNLMHADKSGRPLHHCRGSEYSDAMDETIAAAQASPALSIFVTNEVGSGIVPENAMARAFRDLAGSMNQRFAEAADEVYWMAFGQPLRVK